MIVTEVASGQDDGGDGRFDYRLTVEGPNASRGSTSGSSLFGSTPAVGDAFPGEEERPSIVIDFSGENELFGFITNVEGGGVPVTGEQNELMGGEPPFVALLSDGVPARGLLLPVELAELLEGEAIEGSQFIVEIPYFAFEPGAETIVISFDWLFASKEGHDGDQSPNNDVAYYFTGDDRVGLLSSVAEIAPDMFSDWQATTLIFDIDDLPQETISFGFGVLNIGDEEGLSILTIDNITLIGVSQEIETGSQLHVPI